MKLALILLTLCLLLQVSTPQLLEVLYEDPEDCNVRCRKRRRCNKRRGDWEKVIPSGRCCPICVRTDKEPQLCPAFCPEPKCGEFELIFHKPGDCCPSCIRRGRVGPGSRGKPPVRIEESEESEEEFPCRDTLCPLIYCPGQYYEKGDCCPRCPDCSTFKCAQQLECNYGYTSVVPPGQCCARCELLPGCKVSPCLIPPCPVTCEDDEFDPSDCARILCARPECDNFYTPPNQCCPICPDCSRILCPPAQECPRGSKWVVPPGECCGQCKKCIEVVCVTEPCDFECIPVEDECDEVLCPAILCKPGHPLVGPPEGECCDRCGTLLRMNVRKFFVLLSSANQDIR